MKPAPGGELLPPLSPAGICNLCHWHAEQCLCWTSTEVMHEFIDAVRTGIGLEPLYAPARERANPFTVPYRSGNRMVRRVGSDRV